MTTPTTAEVGHGSEACPTPPTLFNQTFRFEEDTNGHALHVWAWLSNPSGLTNPANPNVDTTYCP